MKSFFAAAGLAIAVAILHAGVAAAPPAAADSPQAAVDSLLDADRAFAAAARSKNVVDGLTAMFAEDVWMPTPAATFARSKAAAAEVLASNPANRTAHVEWTPVRGGISADGSHGFTFGYIATREAGKPDRPGKYLAYWVRKPEGWRVAAYRRVPRAAGEVSTAMLDPALPARPMPATGSVEAHAGSLADAERAFAAEAQQVGLRAAFAKWGRADAMNMGSGAGFDIGAATIAAKNFDEAKTSPLDWAPDAGVIVAPSGDLGVNLGHIRAKGSVPAGQPAAVPFFTIWKRDGLDQPWRYIAE